MHAVYPAFWKSESGFILEKVAVIISHMISGLGNQMFQYAAGRALSLARVVLLRLDTQNFESYALHNVFELHRIFGPDVPITSKKRGHRNRRLLPHRVLNFQGHSVR